MMVEMRIGIDASRMSVNEPTGTERYSLEVITRLVALPEASKHEWVIYTRENIKLPYLWTQVGLAARTWLDDLDVLWVPAHTLPILRRPGLKTVVTIHGIEYEWLPAYENWLQRWYLPMSTQYAVKAADKIIAVSNFTKQQLVERLGADPGKIKVIYEGVSQKNQTVNQQVTNQVLAKFKLQKKKYLLFIGTIQPRKNLAKLIEAYEMAKVPDIKLVIAGKWGWGYQELQDKKTIDVIFTGYISDEERDILLSQALAYVQPSITEGFGLPVLEAWLSGVPVVSSNGGALEEIVGQAGLLFDPENTKEISSGLKKIVDNGGLRKELIAKGKDRVKEFNWEKTTKETYSIITDF